MNSNNEFFNDLYVINYPYVYNFIYRICPYSSLVEDIVQETFYIAYRRLDVLLEHENPVGWLFVTSKNVCRARIRLERKYHSENKEESRAIVEAGSYEQGFGNVEIEDILKTCLSGEELTLFNNFYASGYSLKEISQATGKKPSAISQRLYRIREKLRKYYFFIFLVLEIGILVHIKVGDKIG